MVQLKAGIIATVEGEGSIWELAEELVKAETVEKVHGIPFVRL